MTDADPDFVAWHDPLGTVHGNFALRERRTRQVSENVLAFCDQFKSPREIAPIFCEVFGNNVYTVRKYLGGSHPIIPERCAAYPHALFPNGPPDQDDLVKLERDRGHPDFFNALFSSACPRAPRVERALQWLREHHPDRLEELRDAGANLKGDLTTADDRLTEVIVAFLAEKCARLPASSVEFIRAVKDAPRPEFRIIGEGVRAVFEVKRIQRFPTLELEDLWLKAYRRDKYAPAKRRVNDELYGRLQAGLASVPEGQTVQVEEPPWQKTVSSVVEQVRKADHQLAGASRDERKVIVLYSDDPHTLTDPTGTGPGGRVNRIEAAVVSCLGTLKNADAVVVLGHPDGFPIGNWHCAKFYSNDGREVPEVSRLFDGLPLLEAAAYDLVMLGAQITLPPHGTGTLEIRPQ